MKKQSWYLATTLMLIGITSVNAENIQLYRVMFYDKATNAPVIGTKPFQLGATVHEKVNDSTASKQGMDIYFAPCSIPIPIRPVAWGGGNVKAGLTMYSLNTKNLPKNLKLIDAYGSPATRMIGAGKKKMLLKELNVALAKTDKNWKGLEPTRCD